MSDPLTSPDIPSVISSPASAGGVTLSDSPDGRMSVPSGPAVARANLSARQAKERGLLTSGTYGPPGCISYRSADLQRCLVNRLRTTLRGSTLFRQTWKEKVTPLGRPYWAHTASGHRTSDSGFTGWPTARESDGEKNVRTLDGSLREIERKGCPQDLNQAAMLAGWPTPVANDDNKSPEAHLAMKQRMGERDGTGANRTAITSLQVMAKLVGGETLSGSNAPIRSDGQLNPVFTRWLMGFPAAWDSCGATAMQSCRKSPRRS